MRPMMSIVLPAANGTTARMIFSFGHAAAKLLSGSVLATAAAAANLRTPRRSVMPMRLPPE